VESIVLNEVKYYIMEYTCKRCGYTTNIKSNLKKHFNKKKECEAKLSNVSIESLKSEVTSDKVTDEKNTILKIILERLDELTKQHKELQEQYRKDITILQKEISTLKSKVTKAETAKQNSKNSKLTNNF